MPNDDFDAYAREWITSRNHNFLRLTRILKCLRTVGLHPYARALFTALTDVYRRYAATIGESTYSYWADAMSAPMRNDGASESP